MPGGFSEMNRGECKGICSDNEPARSDRRRNSSERKRRNSDRKRNRSSGRRGLGRVGLDGEGGGHYSCMEHGDQFRRRQTSEKERQAIQAPRRLLPHAQRIPAATRRA